MARQRQTGLPVLISNPEDKGTMLEPCDSQVPPFRENVLQELIAAHPGVIPIQELEPAYGPLLLLGKEVPVANGVIDLLFTSPTGLLTIVETKLWDNSGARREVVGQIIEYCKDLSCFTYEQLVEALKQSQDYSGRTPVVVGKEYDPEVDEYEFKDNINRCLETGRILLIIAGNAIRENVESMAGFLQKTPGLQFSLALVELTLYRMGKEDYPLYIQPRTVARTVEIERAIVKISAPDGFRVSVDLPSEEPKTKARARRNLTEEAFYDELEANTSNKLAEQIRVLLERLEELGLVCVWRAASVSMRYPDPGSSTARFTVIVVTTQGTGQLGWLDRISDTGGYSPAIAEKYLSTVQSLVPDLDVQEQFDLRKLLEHEDLFLEAVRELTTQIANEANRRDD